MFQSEIGKVILQRLDAEEVIWLTTVSSSGIPQPRPVWFEWDGETILIFSQKNAAKVRHIQHNPNVALNFNTDADGGNVGVLIGQAQIAVQNPDADRMRHYLSKYQVGIANLGMTPEQMIRDYPMTILVRPMSIRGF